MIHTFLKPPQTCVVLWCVFLDETFPLSVCDSTIEICVYINRNAGMFRDSAIEICVYCNHNAGMFRDSTIEICVYCNRNAGMLHDSAIEICVYCNRNAGMFCDSILEICEFSNRNVGMFFADFVFFIMRLGYKLCNDCKSKLCLECSVII